MTSGPVAKKAYYSIGEVCDLTGLKPHVLRYWETQFQVLRPSKNRAGNRVYRPKEVQVVLLVKHLCAVFGLELPPPPPLPDPGPLALFPG